MVILIDTNVIIDYLIGRADFVASEKIIDEYCTNGIVQGFVAANSIPDIFYILRKDFSDNERRQILLDLLEIVNVVSIDKMKLQESLRQINFLDFEDCIQSKCAEDVFADYIITRNPKDFLQSKVPIISATEFVKIIECQSNQEL